MKPIVCPFCRLVFRFLLVNRGDWPDPAPLLCSTCLHVSLLSCAAEEARKPTEEELAALKVSPAWGAVIGPAIASIRAMRIAQNARNN